MDVANFREIRIGRFHCKQFFFATSNLDILMRTMHIMRLNSCELTIIYHIVNVPFIDESIEHSFELNLNVHYSNELTFRSLFQRRELFTIR